MTKDLIERILILHKDYSGKGTNTECDKQEFSEFMQIKQDLRALLESEGFFYNCDGTVLPGIALKGLYVSEDCFLSTLSQGLNKDKKSFWGFFMYGRSNEKLTDVRNKLKQYFEEKGFTEPDVYLDYEKFKFK